MSAPRDPGTKLFLWFAAAKLLVQLSALQGYGWFRDELYYVECARHLAWGYVDQPPFSIALLALVTRACGVSLFAVRLVPALLGAGTVWVTGLLARDLGGGRAAQALAMLAMLVAPAPLAMDHYYSMNAIELFLWPLAAWLALRAMRREQAHDWIALGLVVGAGALNKLSMLWFAGAFAIAMPLTPARRALRSPWPWAAGAMIAVLQLPHVAWQVANHWPTLEFMRNATGFKMVAVPPVDFFSGQLLIMNPLAAPLWIVGLIALLRSREPAQRVQALIFVMVMALILFSGKSRASYLVPAYTVLFAAGGGAFERAFRGGRAWLHAPVMGLLLLSGAAFAPLTLPLLSEDAVVAWTRRLGLRPKGEEHHRYGALSQQYADMHGWQAMADTVASVVARLTPQERAATTIFAQNYGEASAINLLGHGLPRCVSGHNNYWLWGPGREARVVVIVGGDPADNRQFFARVDSVSQFHAPWVMPYEDSLTIWVAREPRAPLSVMWPKLKGYD